jgi:predicted phage terminase large subunit-like protein
LLANLRKKFAGTRRGKQELEGLILDDVPGALFTYPNIESHRVWEAPKDFRSMVVAVDPPGSSHEGSNECGIVAGGLTRQGRGYVLSDISDVMSPDVWGREAVLLHDRLQADHIVIEVNQGGEMCRTVLESAAERLWRTKERQSRSLVVKMVHASRGKEIRAEPVSQLYEQGFISHVGEFEQLEDQMIHFTKDYDRKRDGSPDRLDAMVWLFTDLLVTAEPDISDGLLHTLDRQTGWRFGAMGA